MLNKYLNQNIAVAVIVIFSFVNCKGIEPETPKTATHPFDLSQGFIKLDAVVSDTIHGVFALDNGKGKTSLDSAFFYSKFDVSKFVLRKNRFGPKVYEGKIPMKIGTHSFVITVFSVLDMEKIGAKNTNGIIGVEPFLNQIVNIDFEHLTISFSDSLKVDDSYSKNKMLLSLDAQKGTKTSNMKFVKIQCFGVKPGEKVIGHMEFDLGCQGSDILVMGKFIKRLNAKSIKKGTVELYFGLQKSGSEGYKVDSVVMGGYTINNIFAARLFIIYKNEPEMDGLWGFNEGDGYLGIDFWRRFNLIADYKNDVLYLKPNPNYKSK